MMRIGVAVLLGAALGVGAARADRPAQGEGGLLPPDGFAGDWRRSEASEAYVGEALYNHIDGGAELFFEFGFVVATVQRYKAGADELILEIYRMVDPTAAAGIYLMKCGKETPDRSLPARHTVGRRQLMLWKGDYFVVVTHAEGEANRRKSLLAYGRFVQDRVAQGGAPEALGWLPRRGLIEPSVRLIRGPYALQSLITLGDGDILQLGGKVTAAAGDYPQPGGSPYTVLTAVYPDPEAAGAALAGLRKGLDSQLTRVPTSGGALVFVDGSRRYGDARLSGTHLTVRFGLVRRP